MARDRTLVLGDVHLAGYSPGELSADLARLFDGARGGRVVVAGDLLDLVTEAPGGDRLAAIGAILAAHPAVRPAIGRLLESGGELVLAGGNHDADLGSEALRPALLAALGLGARAGARLRTTPWFVREGPERDVHVEHGHFYEPDNAPAHPLVVGAPSLGQHFSAEFMSATQAHRYLQANDLTPLALFVSAFRWYGPRAPYVVYRYFHTAFAALGKAGPWWRGRGERALGRAEQARFAEESGVPLPVVEQVLAVGAPSTLESWAATFARLYLDRVAGTVLVGAGLGTAALAGRDPRWRRLGITGVGLGGACLAASWLHGHDRYRGNVVEHLDRSAARIAATSGARLVVFGHTHREAQRDGYANTGAFAWPRGAPGRPYLAIEHGPHGPQAVRRYLTAAQS